MNDKFVDVADDEIISDMNKLMEKYENISPDLTALLKEWSRLRREIEAYHEEIKKRNIDI